VLRIIAVGTVFSVTLKVTRRDHRVNRHPDLARTTPAPDGRTKDAHVRAIAHRHMTTPDKLNGHADRRRDARR
jgi:hypothetical protein